ncbi:MAG: hypothetical protein K8W52_04155 [Deltaproteobacteria bacterium]|nr:hypothetical protein [Deltaproteobacteria bacterium]
MAASGFSTKIIFDGTKVPVEQQAISVSIGHFATSRFGWTLTAGAIVHGQIEGRAIDGGGSLGGTISWLWVREQPRRPFVALTGSLSTGLTRGTADDGTARWWSANDLRGGAMLGKTLGTRWVPYATARVFGGPVFWRRGGERVYGGDHYHFSVGAGLTVRLPGQLDLSIEAMPLGEQSAALGVTAHR